MEGFKWIAYIFALITDVDYPQSSKEWRNWIWNILKISEEEGIRLYEQEKFPSDSLLEAWNVQFSTDHGYSPQFIPAFTRNVNGFVSWVYGNGPEPNWAKSDV